MAVKSPTGGAVLAGAPGGRRQRPTRPQSRTGRTHGGRCSGFCPRRATVPLAPQRLSAEHGPRIQPGACEQDGVSGPRAWQPPPHTEPLPRKRGTSPWGGGSLRSQSVLSSRCASGLCAHVLPPGHVLPHPPMHPTQLSPRALASAVTRHSHCLRQARESGTLPPGSPGTPALRARRAVGAQRVCRPQERTRTDKPSRPSSRPTVPATPGVRRPRARPREAGAPARRQTPLAPEDAPPPVRPLPALHGQHGRRPSVVSAPSVAPGSGPGPGCRFSLRNRAEMAAQCDTVRTAPLTEPVT